MSIFDRFKDHNPSKSDTQDEDYDKYAKAEKTSYPNLYEMVKDFISPNNKADVMIEHMQHHDENKTQTTDEKTPVTVSTSKVLDQDSIVTKIGHSEKPEDPPEVKNVKTLQTQISDSQHLIDKLEENGDYAAASQEKERLNQLKEELRKAVNKMNEKNHISLDSTNVNTGNNRFVSSPDSSQIPLQKNENNLTSPQNQNNELEQKEKKHSQNIVENDNDNNFQNEKSTKKSTEKTKVLPPQENNSANGNLDDENYNNDDLQVINQVILNSNKYYKKLPTELSLNDKLTLQENYIKAHLPARLIPLYEKLLTEESEKYKNMSEDEITKKYEATMKQIDNNLNNENEIPQENNSTEDNSIDENGENEDPQIGYVDNTNEPNTNIPETSEMHDDNESFLIDVQDPTFNITKQITIDSILLNRMRSVMINASQIYFKDKDNSILCFVDRDTDIKLLRNNNPETTFYKVTSNFDDVKSKLEYILNHKNNVKKDMLFDKYLID